MKKKAPAMKKTGKVDPAKKINRMNALDAAITSGKALPSKNKKYPGDTDVKMKGFKKKPVIKLDKKKK